VKAAVDLANFHKGDVHRAKAAALVASFLRDFLQAGWLPIHATAGELSSRTLPLPAGSPREFPEVTEQFQELEKTIVSDPRCSEATIEGCLEEPCGPGKWEYLEDVPPAQTPLSIDVNSYKFALRPFGATLLDMISRVMTDRGKVLRSVSGRSHYLYNNTYCPDDELAKDIVREVGKQMAVDIHEVETARRIFFPGSNVFIGGPVSNKATALLLQYYPNDPTNLKAGMRRGGFPTIRLPYELQIDPEVPPDPETGAVSWLLRKADIGGCRKEIFKPKKDRYDYLMVARVPNILERRRNGEFKNTVLLFGGTHGVGTAAVKLLFREEDILADLLKKTRGSEFWQAIFKVGIVKEGLHELNRYRPLPVSLDPKFEFIHMNPY
jgi:hypothetical protein